MLPAGDRDEMNQRQRQLFEDAQMFPIGCKVRLKDPDYSDLLFIVVGVVIEYQESRADFGVNYRLATAEEISRQRGCLDGFSPADLELADGAAMRH